MSKNLYLCVPDPFDSSTGARLERMGILRPDGEVNVEVMRAFVQIFGGLFFDDLCDFYSRPCGKGDSDFPQVRHEVLRQIAER